MKTFYNNAANASWPDANRYLSAQLMVMALNKRIRLYSNVVKANTAALRAYFGPYGFTTVDALLARANTLLADPLNPANFPEMRFIASVMENAYNQNQDYGQLKPCPFSFAAIVGSDLVSMEQVGEAGSSSSTALVAGVIAAVAVTVVVLLAGVAVFRRRRAMYITAPQPDRVVSLPETELEMPAITIEQMDPELPELPKEENVCTRP
eukprot:TRINITY_DN2529_c1_g2_i2.p1 TRINITY_DN2529_c1_g2~~TRINITY_DN2529_c1_g2_i2.p1  ORF type:complete len:208 (+),score=60.08 TRINITY_DN2529_c1_g2_i2:1288-1911(+)